MKINKYKIVCSSCPFTPSSVQVFHYSKDLFWRRSTSLHYSARRFSFSFFQFLYLWPRSHLYGNNTGIRQHYDSSNNDSTPEEMWRGQPAVESEALPGTPYCRRSGRAWMKRGSIYHWKISGFPPSWFNESSSNPLGLPIEIKSNVIRDVKPK